MPEAHEPTSIFFPVLLLSYASRVDPIFSGPQRLLFTLSGGLRGTPHVLMAIGLA